MTSSLLLLLVILVVMGVCFVAELLPIELTALSGLFMVVALGYLSADEMFSGFSSPAVVIIAATFIVGSALKSTGVADQIAQVLARYFGRSERSAVFGVVVVGIAFSSFMANVAATALLLPVVVSFAAMSRLSPSKLLIPLAFSVVLGGMLTAIGTTPNIIASSEIQRALGFPIRLFSFSLFAAPIVVVCALYLVFRAPAQLPAKIAAQELAKNNLQSLYGLGARLVVLELPQSSPLAGVSLEDLNLSRMIDGQVLSIVRKGKRIVAPGGEEVLQVGDSIFLKADRKLLSALQNLFEFERKGQVTFEERPQQLHFLEIDTVAVPIEIDNEEFDNEGLIFLDDNRERSGGRRSGSGKIVVASKDEAALARFQAQFSQLRSNTFHHGIPDGWNAMRFVFPDTTRIEIQEEVKGCLERLACRFKPDGKEGTFKVLMPFSQELAVEGLGALRVLEEGVLPDLESSEGVLCEVVLSPRSELFGQSLRDLRFREQYGAQVVALWREGRPYRLGLASIALRLGDALLLQLPKSQRETLAKDPNFLLLDQSSSGVPFPGKQWVVLLSLAVFFALSSWGGVGLAFAAALSGLLVLVFGAVTPQQAYREIEWRVLFLVGALLPFSHVIQRAGFSEWMSDLLLHFGTSNSMWVGIVVLSILSSLISQMLDSSLPVIMLSPVALALSRVQGIDPYPLMIAITLSASIAFLTPFSHKAHLLVMGAGGYSTRDYFRVGLPVTIFALLALWAGLWFASL